MTKSELQDILQSPYQRNNWQKLLTEVFTKGELKQSPSKLPLKNDLVKDAFELGNFETSDGRIISLYEVNVNDHVILERNRVTLRNQLKSYYCQCDGAFAVFWQKGKWRFTFVSEIAKRNEQGEWEQSKTEPKRFTYILGEGEKVRTATDRFFLLLNNSSVSLENIKEAFSVEKVTKEFYKEIAYWYFWAVKEVRFPKDAEEENNGRNISVIRMITRIIFIWFMKQKGLINPALFDIGNISNLLKNFSPEKSTYYKAILQNLFFATLNTKIKDRKFRFNISGWKNSSYMDHTVFRYEDYFRNKKDMLALFKDIPFLNGGLFDCLDKRDDSGKELRFDGFSDNEKELKVPNYLFFSEETETDLNKDLGTTNKKYKVKGLINILNAYNFVIDENDPNDIDIALDPELLGKVFENLLASFNPETSSTARKATGSYYTPREIVDYMVNESLIQYFLQNLTPENLTPGGLSKKSSLAHLKNENKAVALICNR